MNTRTKERRWVRGAVNFVDGVLNAMDGLEQGKSIQQAIGDGFRKTWQKQTVEDRPIGFQPPEEIKVEVREARPTTAEVPYCEIHGVPKILCTICKGRGE